ncbi:MAG: hypothetical protein KDB03_07910 [Planctomycetales bacterium]|nr:hypothetical protein [Planctomycetales bacterium]
MSSIWLTGVALPASGQVPTPIVSEDENNLLSPQAISSEPFGIVTFELPIPVGIQTTPRVIIAEADGRVFYPTLSVRSKEVVEQQPLPPLAVGRPGGLIDRLRNVIRGEPKTRQIPVALTVRALFTGQTPLRIQISGDIGQQVFISPVTGDEPALDQQFQSAIQQWWIDFSNEAGQVVERGDVPTLVHQYLHSMLSRRLDLPYLALNSEPTAPSSQPLQTLALLAAIEPLREQILATALQDTSGEMVGDRPLPMEPNWAPTPSIAQPLPTETESIAAHVPPECFYLRFGSFSNYVWFQEISQRFGGDLAQAVLLRGFNHEAAERIERMLGTKLTAVAKMFGDKIITDMALVGTDLYMKEGASVGVLFEAANVAILKQSMETDRSALLKKYPGAQLQQLNIEGESATLLSTPDNRLRSFLVIHDKFVFVTTSEHLAQRFIQVASGDRSLADLPHFQATRGWMPQSNGYTVFGYFSPEFFYHLVSPKYQIELQRRLKAIAHLEIAEVAALAARAEGHKVDDLKSLASFGFLPEGFDKRPDGARVLNLDGEWIDSLRGARGSFLPIEDVEIDGVTSVEAQQYGRIAAFYQQQWKNMDPMVVGVRRYRSPAGPTREQVAVEGYIAPFVEEKYGWIGRQLAPPTPLEIRLPADDAASLQLHIRDDALIIGSGTTDYHLFAGVKDMMPPEPEEIQGLIKTLQALRATPGYIGAWPKPGLIERLPLGLGLARPDYAGYTRLIGGLWRWQNAGFSLLSFDRSIIENAIPQIAPVESSDPAQARLRVADLTNSTLSNWINIQWYRRGLRASRGNALLLDSFHQYLKVPSAECLAIAEGILDVKLQCPVGGEYELVRAPFGEDWWISSAWQLGSVGPTGKPMPPLEYCAPWLEWFRGGKFHLTQLPGSLSVVGTLELELPPFSTPKSSETGETQSLLPELNFDLFQLPSMIFGGQNSKTPVDTEPKRRSF